MSFTFITHPGFGFYCSRCREEWTEQGIVDAVGDNEDDILIAESMDYCPDCIGELFPDYQIGG